MIRPTRDKVILMHLTEEEIARLPFQETARRLGGILVLWTFRDMNAPENDPSALRKQFYDCIESSRQKFKLPTIGDDK